MIGRLWVSALGGAFLLGAVSPTPAAAHMEVLADTVQAADTVRSRVLERVQQRARPLSRDSLIAQAEAGRDARNGEPRRQDEATGGAPADSTMEVLMRLEGYDFSQYEGRRADFEAGERRLLLTGDEEQKARFTGDGADLEADSSIVYDERTGRVRTVGATTLTADQADPLTSRTMIYDLAEGRGSAREARTEYREGANWIVWGELDSVDREEAWMSRARFTSCDHEEPHYFFQANDMKVIRENVLVARSVRMYLADVPIAWIPFIAQNLGSGRASGLLTPRFSMNDVVRTSEGQNRRISNLGYYWAMSEYSDAELALDWFSNNYTALTGAVRYRWARQFLDGSLSFRQFWRDTGGRELAFNTQHNWEYSERTRMHARGSYASSSDFVREQSFDPRETTQSIDSEGGLSHRFDWGNLSLSANRRQFLSDDRVEMTLPTASLNLTTRTLFEAPPTQAGWYNNLTVSANTNFSRSSMVREPQTVDDFRISLADRLQTRGRAGLTFGLGSFSFSNRVEYQDQVFRDLPSGLFPETQGSAARLLTPWFQDAPPPNGELPVFRDMGESEIAWSSSLSYQQNFLGSSTFTPSVSVENRFARSDTVPEAMDNFISSPTRVSFGASVRTDVYGFYDGFRDYEAIRHKLTPNFRYSYAPEVTPTELQERVFGARGSRVRNEFTVGLNQTFEARMRPSEDDPVEEAPVEEAPDAVEGALPEVDAVPGTDFDEEEDEEPGLPPLTTSASGAAGDPERRPRSEVVRLLSLQTSAITYDLVEADSLGYFMAGFRTTRLSNQISSDFLRGLSLSVEHDLFEPPAAEGERRSFSPHLSQMNFSFDLSDRSSIVRFLYDRLGIDPREDDEEPEELEDEEDPFESRDGPDTSRMLPGERRSTGLGVSGSEGGWNARISYSLRRPRGIRTPGAASPSTAQMIQGNLSFRPSQNWNVSWRTSYDVEENRFLDHMVQFRRDLHRWEANLGFRQTAVGNWSFVFEVSLIDNRDLRFDHRLRSREGRSSQLPLGLDP